MQVICLYGKNSKTSIPLGFVVNLNAIIHLNNKNEWSQATDVQIPHAYSCTPNSAGDCSFSVIS